jgi:hypothetical protein
MNEGYCPECGLPLISVHDAGVLNRPAYESYCGHCHLILEPEEAMTKDQRDSLWKVMETETHAPFVWRTDVNDYFPLGKERG